MYPGIPWELVADPLGSVEHNLGIIAFAGKHWLRDRSSVVCYTYIPYLVFSHFIHTGCEVLSVNMSSGYPDNGI